MFNRAEIVDRNFAEFLRGWDKATRRKLTLDEPVRPGSALRGALLLQLFESQMVARHLDLAARRLRAEDAGQRSDASAHELRRLLHGCHVGGVWPDAQRPDASIY